MHAHVPLIKLRVRRTSCVGGMYALGSFRSLLSYQPTAELLQHHFESYVPCRALRN